LCAAADFVGGGQLKPRLKPFRRETGSQWTAASLGPGTFAAQSVRGPKVARGPHRHSASILKQIFLEHNPCYMTRLFTLAFLAALLGACDSNPAGTEEARLTILLTDAPGDIVSAEVEILEIYLQPRDDDDDDGGDDEGNGRKLLYSGGETFDLLDLQNGVTAVLADVSVPAGTYNQLRLILGDIEIETEGGETFSNTDQSLICPSCAQSGLKIQLPAGGLRLEAGQQNVLIDFDVAQSFGHQAGNSGKWVMHPVIKAERTEPTTE